MVFQMEYNRFLCWVIWVWRLAGYHASLAELGLESDGGFFKERLLCRKRVTAGYQAASEEHCHGVEVSSKVSVL
jgi:hypothetical protein